MEKHVNKINGGKNKMREINYKTISLTAGNSTSYEGVDGMFYEIVPGSTTGSVFITLSGTTTGIFQTADLSTNYYPVEFNSDVSGASISGTAYSATTNIYLNDTLQVVASGIGGAVDLKIRYF